PFAETHGPVGMDVQEHKIHVKLPVAKKLARNWSRYLTEESAARRPSALKAAFKHLTTPGLIALGGGLPLPAYFPIQEVVVKVPTIGKWSETETRTHGTDITIVKYATAQSTTANGVYQQENCTRTKELSHTPVVGL